MVCQARNPAKLDNPSKAPQTSHCVSESHAKAAADAKAAEAAGTPKTEKIMKNHVFLFFFQAEDGIRDAQESRGLGDVYKRQPSPHSSGFFVALLHFQFHYFLLFLLASLLLLA